MPADDKPISGDGALPQDGKNNDVAADRSNTEQDASPSKSPYRFTLPVLALACAILLVGALGSQLCMFVTPVGTSIQLDGQQLTKFIGKLKVKVQSNRQVFESVGDQGSFRALALELYRRKVLTIDDLGTLAGASGTTITFFEAQHLIGDDVSWDPDQTFDPDEFCLFTGPSDGKTLVRLLTADTQKDGVLFCYSCHWYKTQPDDGMVVYFVGTEEAELMQPDAIAERYNALNPDVPTTFGGDLKDLAPDFYGKPPFANVKPE